MNENKLRITSKTPKGDDGHKVFSIRIEDELYSAIENIAGKTGRSRNEIIGILLKYAIENCEVDTEE